MRLNMTFSGNNGEKIPASFGEFVLGMPPIDTTLTKAGFAADAYETGKRLDKKLDADKLAPAIKGVQNEVEQARKGAEEQIGNLADAVEELGGDAVRHDIDQNLTETHKMRARANIGAHAVPFEVTETDGEHTSSMTYSQLKEYSELGYTLICLYKGLLHSFVQHIASTDYDAFIFALSTGVILSTVAIDNENNVIVEEIEPTITINGQDWNGLDAANVDFTDTINDMIDDKVKAPAEAVEAVNEDLQAFKESTNTAISETENELQTLNKKTAELAEAMGNVGEKEWQEIANVTLADAVPFYTVTPSGEYTEVFIEGVYKIETEETAAKSVNFSIGRPGNAISRNTISVKNGDTVYQRAWGSISPGKRALYGIVTGTSRFGGNVAINSGDPSGNEYMSFDENNKINVSISGGAHFFGVGSTIKIWGR